MDGTMRTQHDLVGPEGIGATVLDDTKRLVAGDVMQCGVVSIDAGEPIKNAVMLLLERDISGLPVTREGQLEGMLSEKDLLRLLYEKEYLPGYVEDYMSRGVVSFDVETDLAVIHKQLIENSFRRVPILLGGRLAGMITRSDLIRVYLERVHPSASESQGGDQFELRAEDAMKRGLLTIHPDAPLYDAMDMIARHRVTGLPVVDEGMHLLGLVTEKDVLDGVGRPKASAEPVRTCMTENVVAFDRKTSLLRICACLIENDFHRVPIVDGTRLVGIVSRSDILKHRAAIFRI